MKTCRFFTFALTAMLTTGQAHAAYETEIAEEQPNITDEGGPSGCDVWLHYDDPLPPPELGVVVCIYDPPINTNHLPPASDPYAYPPDRFGHEDEYGELCTDASTLSGIKARSFARGEEPTGWEVSWVISDHFGGDMFGAGAQMGAFLKAEPEVPATDESEGHADRILAGAGLSAAATVFGKSVEILSIGADASAEFGAEATASAHVYALGLVSWDSAMSGEPDEGAIPLHLEEEYSQELISASMPIAIGPVVVTVSGGATAEFGIHGDAGPTIEAQGTGIKVVGTPYARLFGTAGVSVGFKKLLGAGVNGELTLIRAEVPSTGVILFDQAGDVRWSLDSDLELGSLDGSLTAWVQAIAKFELTLVEWDGFSTIIPLFHLGNCRSELGS